MRFQRKPGKVYVEWNEKKLGLVEARKVTQGLIDRNLVYEMSEMDWEGTMKKKPRGKKC